MDKKIIRSQIKEIFDIRNPIDLERLKTTLKTIKKKAKKTIFKIPKAKIFVVMGMTGVGKSTTICYLKGCEMVRSRGSIKVAKNSLIPAPCKIGSSIVSATRGFNPVEIDLPPQLKIKEESVFLCDTAGFHDTEGTYFNLLNSFSITACVKYASLVKPVLIISEKSCGARFEEVLNLVKLIIKMIPNKFNLGCCDYFFTDFTNHTQQGIEEKLEMLHKSVESDEKLEDTELILFVLADMRKKVKLLDLVKNEPSVLGILSNWIEISNNYIQHPEECFFNYISERDLAKVTNQINMISDSIDYYLKAKDSEMVNFKLGQLHSFSKLFSHLKENYPQKVNDVVYKLNAVFALEIENFQKKLERDESLSLSQIQTYERFEFLNIWEKIRKDHEMNKVINADLAS